MSPKIFLLEDDALLHGMLKEFLEGVGFSVRGAYDGSSALEILSSAPFDLLIFDVQVPSGGLETLQSLRDLHIQTPAIFISVRSDMPTLRQAFKVGASDYLKKPFDPEELQVRIERLLIPRMQVGDYVYEDGALKKGNQTFFLSHKEKQLLEFLLRHRHQVLSSDQIIASVWSYESGIDDSTLRTHIKNLRKILGKECIQNLKGLGYCLHA